MGKHTPLYDAHVRMGGKMVDFAGWVMPIHYGSQIEEHHAVRNDAGMFDVSHMTVVDLFGEHGRAFLRKLLANNIDRLQAPGRALYSCMLDERGGVIDDLIVYFLREDFFRLVVNAATRDKDLAWLRRQAEPFGVELRERPELAMIAVQGPNARHRVLELLPAELRDDAAELRPFFALAGGDWFVARTGYTGEDGFELILPAADAQRLWDALAELGVRPVGLGARDTLRLEAGMNLYGSDMTEDTSPLEAGLEWTVAWEPAERDFIGRAALEAQREAGVPRRLVGLLLEGKGVLRAHQRVLTTAGEGEITSGGFSPTLGRSIALARIPAGADPARVEVEIRDRPQPVRLVQPPFVRHGEAKIELSN
ncbi:glycine cleavage system aminomethyltransferase GcvT [Thiohalobacter sp. IOR34]|uniref:glycine cleavage system aminomethyltransferase GcvT n=1 Tax=Thiohalobacter sp. IOR34 TaxID=3057176 RepID=UPI0025B0FC6F|nr:glycine cleavage system aminomethyltransferase GcvT [Thiohalobacter sp. IOR34]WJW75879.1 glycine cleavage system aminomethyltransferase GcvT [Thiohalobacter sp. IOR34]